MNKLSSEKLNSKKVLLEKLAVIYRDSYDEEPNFNRSGLFHEIALNEEQLSFAEHNPELIQELQSERKVVRDDFDELIASGVFEMDAERIIDILSDLKDGDSYCGFATASVGSCC